MLMVDVKRLNETDEVLNDESLAKALKARAATRRQQAMLAAAGEVELERRWVVVKVEPRRENDVDNLLARALIDHWLPLRKADQPHHGGRKGKAAQPVWTLAWPGYVLVKMPDTPEAWYGVMSVKHVKSVLGVDGRPFFIDDAKVLKLKAELATLKTCNGPETIYVEGEKVMVLDGPFASFPGKVIDIDQWSSRDGRARVEVMIFGRAVPVELELAQLEKGR